MAWAVLAPRANAAIYARNNAARKSQTLPADRYIDNGKPSLLVIRTAGPVDYRWFGAASTRWTNAG
eukprot:2821518-Lingulodinium_polyedra.AAC.1